jgi:hypothetical protein
MAVNAWSSSDFFTLRRVTRLMMVVCLLSLCACAGQREAPPGTPEWVREGQGPAIADGRRYLYGIGVVGKMKSRVLMRAAADNKAKNKLGRAVDDYVDALMAAYAKSSQAGGDAEALTQTHQDLRAVVGALLPAAVISDHWQDPETGNYFALCRLTFSMLLERIAMARILPESLQRFALKEGPLLFDRQNLASGSSV